MQKFINAFLIILALGVAVAACDKGDSNRRTDAPGRTDTDKAKGSTATAPRTDAPGGSAKKMSNSDLENAIKAKLSSDDQLRAANLKVDANADKNEVTISGTVRSQDQRAKAIDVAKSAHSGLTVNDKIDVKPAA
jgi:osmotically-inducible protein OsmY